MKLLNLLSLKNTGWKVVLTVSIIFCTSANSAGRANRIGGNGGESQNISCPQDQYAVGMRVLHNNKIIIKIKLLCQRANRYSGSAIGPRGWSRESRSSRPRGDTGLIMKTVRCDEGDFLSRSIQGHSGKAFAVYTVVTGLKLRCVNFSRINRNTGTSTKRIGRERRLGPKFNGPVETSYGSLVTSTNTGEASLSRLWVHSGYALDSVWAYAKKMPWYRSSSQSNNNTQQAYNPPRAVSGGSTQPAQRPDLYVQSSSPLWRYAGTTNTFIGTAKGLSYRKVANSFCSGGMRQISNPDGSLSRTKIFVLPQIIQYSVINGGGGTAAASRASELFIRAIPNITIPILPAGQRNNRTIARGTIQRCVITGSKLPGCHECANSKPYEDPALVLRVDTTGAVPETNENNNELRR